MEPIVVIVAHAREDVRAGIVETLEESANVVVAAAGARVGELLPDAVLVCDAGAMATAPADTVLIAIADQDPVRCARLALAAGARDIVAWPEERAHLEERVRAAALIRVHGTDRPPGRVVAIAGVRGGLGATTIAGWLAEALGAEPATFDPTSDPVSRARLIDVLAHAGRPVVLDLGRLDAMTRPIAARCAALIVVVGDDVASVRAAQEAPGAAVIVVRRRARGGIGLGDFARALDREPVWCVPTRAGVARAHDLGRTPAPPRGWERLVRAVGSEAPDGGAPGGGAPGGGAPGGRVSIRARLSGRRSA